MFDNSRRWTYQRAAFCALPLVGGLVLFCLLTASAQTKGIGGNPKLKGATVTFDNAGQGLEHEDNIWMYLQVGQYHTTEDSIGNCADCNNHNGYDSYKRIDVNLGQLNTGITLAEFQQQGGQLIIDRHGNFGGAHGNSDWHTGISLTLVFDNGAKYSVSWPIQQMHCDSYRPHSTWRGQFFWNPKATVRATKVDPPLGDGKTHSVNVPPQFESVKPNYVMSSTGDYFTSGEEAGPEITPVIGPQPGTGPLKGFVDLHTHPLSNLGFGGKVVHGGPDIGSLLPDDIDCNHDVRALSMRHALSDCSPTHGTPGLNLNPIAGSIGFGCGDFIRWAVIFADQKANNAWVCAGSSGHGAPDFNEWPNWNDITHQAMWVDWIRRTYLGGLRVMVALAVNSQILGDAVAGHGDYPTDDKNSADLQIKETKAFVSRHSDFMEIAYSPADLERIVRANKLAVVLGIEIDNIGNLNQVHPLTHEAISAEINRLYNEGVRYVFPIHLTDCAFGGTAVYQDLFNYATYYEDGHYWKLDCVTNSNHQFSAIIPLPADVPDSLRKVPGLVPLISLNIRGLNDLIGEALTVKLHRTLPAPPNNHCPTNLGEVNDMGLLPDGEFAVMEMMRHGMFIDIDHMSDKSKNMAISIAERNHYPLNSGHAGLRTFGPLDWDGNPNQINERSMSTNQYARIAKLHGMAGIGVSGLNSYQWTTMYKDVLNVMGGTKAGAALGTDADGMSPLWPPRPNSSVQYPKTFPMCSLGTKKWNYNDPKNGGVAHYGLIPDFLKDVQTDIRGGGGEVYNNLMSGADYFLQTWKICENQKTNIK